MSLFDLTVQGLTFARSNAIDEVLKMTYLGLAEVRNSRTGRVGDLREADIVEPIRDAGRRVGAELSEFVT